MKTFAFFVFVGCCLTSISAFAQTPKQIEADLLRSLKTASRITNHLYYSYNQNESNEDVMGDNTLEYDSKDTTITFPVIDTDGHQTDTAITYKFTGKYFEKVKN